MLFIKFKGARVEKLVKNSSRFASHIQNINFATRIPKAFNLPNPNHTLNWVNSCYLLARLTPFTLTVVTDANEVVGAAAGAVDQTTTNEASADDANSRFPLGTMGFSLKYAQQACQ